jgi:diguanylate cyclase (GGDEF)-like protein
LLVDRSPTSSVIQLAPNRALGGRLFANLMVVLGLVSAALIPRLPWERYGRDLFAFVHLYAALLISGLIYSTGGTTSPFAATYLLISITAGLYHQNRVAYIVTAACACFGYLPYLYAQPGSDFFFQQLLLSVGAFACAAFHRLMVPELLHRARREQGLQDDLRETRELRDELARANAQLARQAQTDPLTGLLNHGAIVAQTDRTLDRAAERRETVSLLFFDIDRFKQINDTYGHQAGDAILSAMALRTVVALRHGDIVGRYGGEEFLALLPATDASEALGVAERLRQSIAAEPFILPNGQPLAVTVSIGIATASGADDRAALLHAADQALYRAKRAGRDCVYHAQSAA